MIKKISIIYGEKELAECQTGDGFGVCSNTLLPELIHPFQNVNEVELGLSLKEAYKCIANEFNHGGIFYRNCEGNLFVVEAIGRGIKKTPIKKYLKDKRYAYFIVIKWDLPVDDEKATIFLDTYVYHKKTRYAFFNLLAFAVYYTTWKNVWIGTSEKNFTAFCCWHFVAHFYNTIIDEVFLKPQRISAPDILLRQDNKAYYIRTNRYN